MHSPFACAILLGFKKFTCAYLFQISQEKSCDYLYKLGIAEGNSQGEWDLQVPGKCLVGDKLQLHCNYW